jgi:predicted phosphoribosyltransferase
VLAAPVGSPERADMLRAEADRVECLIEDPALFAVGQYYVDFRTVEDDEVLQILADYHKSAAEEALPAKRGAPRRPRAGGAK